MKADIHLNWVEELKAYKIEWNGEYVVYVERHTLSHLIKDLIAIGKGVE